MHVVDFIIIILLLFGALIGFKRGTTRQLVSLVGTIAIIILAFLFKNQLSILFYENLPFFNLFGSIKGVTVLNIALYEFLAFFIVLAGLTIILRILMFATAIFERILTFTIILGIPSKIVGALLGVVESYLYIFIAIYILVMPMFNIDYIRNSTYAMNILNNTPVLSSYLDDSIVVFEEFGELKEKYEIIDDTDQFNKETLDLFLKYNIVTVESIEKLQERGKIDIDSLDSLLDEHR